MPTLLALRPCGHAAGLVCADSPAVPYFRAKWAGCAIVIVPGAEAVTRLQADAGRHHGCTARPHQARMAL